MGGFCIVVASDLFVLFEGEGVAGEGHRGGFGGHAFGVVAEDDPAEGGSSCVVEASGALQSFLHLLWLL